MPAPTPPSSLTAAQVRKIASLARLAISDAELSEHQAALSAVIGYMETLKTLDLSSVDASAAALHGGAGGHGGDGSGSHLAADELGPTLSNETLMRLAPRTIPPFVLVPKVLDDGGGA
jgi:aspartyl-tRNA(Asn)/glutamyl-tRNA(Gln) amidotransferase subunit C